MGLGSLEAINGAFYAHGNDFTNADGLESLTTVGGDFTLDSNPNLENLDGLSSLTTVDGDFRLHNNPSLEDLTGLRNLANMPSYRDIEMDSQEYTVKVPSSSDFCQAVNAGNLSVKEYGTSNDIPYSYICE